jgi:hypothetical protein
MLKASMVQGFGFDLGFALYDIMLGVWRVFHPGLENSGIIQVPEASLFLGCFIEVHGVNGNRAFHDFSVCIVSNKCSNKITA